MRVIFLCFPLFVAMSLQAQLPGEYGKNNDVFEEIESVDKEGGIITIDQSARMKDLVLTHINMNKRSAGVEGFRIQLFSGVGSKARQEALDVKAQVLSEFPDAEIYVEYSAPFWRVRVGSFRHKHETLSLLNKLKKEFPACYVVKVNDIPLNALP
ncbi:SPOR domain-containing protein [Marinilabilia rubra]|uniref:Sporulation protein n=1 Tax=Marinilabilia rubra TaxID=2162893 RepID=A0A2U2BEF6_9BACT|nr:SPOR domain-containing protein [Marinilabilia rubra]PWE01397.1 sporulation protein [Marinilabilia rubra]